MNLAALIVPAVAALAGVALSQMWSGLQARARAREQDRQKSLDERRQSLLRYLVATNKAIDATRDNTRALALDMNDRAGWVPPDDADDLDRDNDHRWAAVFETYLAAELVLPVDARVIVNRHIDETFAWRRRCLRELKIFDAPGHANLLRQLDLWINRDASDTNVRLKPSNPPVNK